MPCRYSRHAKRAINPRLDRTSIERIDKFMARLTVHGKRLQRIDVLPVLRQVLFAGMRHKDDLRGLIASSSIENTRFRPYHEVCVLCHQETLPDRPNAAVVTILVLLPELE